jgi:hypothetical protein
LQSFYKKTGVEETDPLSRRASKQNAAKCISVKELVKFNTGQELAD